MLELNANELRVIGCLIEKSITTPDHYPLSLNGLTTACNQKTNREPVMSLSETEVQETLDSLDKKCLVMGQSGASSRVPKYKHRFCNTEFSDLQFNPQELAVLCVLFLRGPQTPGELRTRTNRLSSFNDVTETEAVLERLANHDKGPYVVRLAREPGKRESRYAHCFGDGEIQNISENTEIGISRENHGSELPLESAVLARISALEETVELLQLEVEELREMLNQPL